MSQANTAIQASAKSIKSLLKGVKYTIKVNLDAIGALYRQLASEIWNPGLLLKEVAA